MCVYLQSKSVVTVYNMTLYGGSVCENMHVNGCVHADTDR